MKPTQANLECADVIMNRNNVPPHIWTNLRRDIAIAITMAERDAAKKSKPRKAQEGK